MVDRITKFLHMLGEKYRLELKLIIEKIVQNDLQGLDVKKLQGMSDAYRVRKGKFRIIFLKGKNANKVIHIERRNDHTYDS